MMQWSSAETLSEVQWERLKESNSGDELKEENMKMDVKKMAVNAKYKHFKPTDE